MEENEKKEKLLITAFSEEEFLDELKRIREEIEKQLKDFIKYAKEKLEKTQMIYDNVESRIKSVESFKEKIYRKNYICSWKIKEDIKENQKTIKNKLPDLIGFRINCFFMEDEKKIYDLMHDYKSFNEISLDFSENTTQQNGHDIYKVAGKYKNEVRFEIQIKSIMNNIWGEVEHETIYKNKNYDTGYETKKTITEQLFNILSASDKQLIALFQQHNDKKTYINALFFEETKNIVSEKIGTDILAPHYIKFFMLFNGKEYRKAIKTYTADRLLEVEYEKEQVVIEKDKSTKELKKRIENEFLENSLKKIYYIFSLLYEVDKYEDFLFFLSHYLLKLSEDEENIDFESDVFSDEDEIEPEKYENLLELLNTKIGGRNNA